MNKDDRRYRAAYHLLRGHIASQIALGHLTGGARAEAERVLASVEAELNPPEFEEVEIVRWSYGSCMDLFDTEEGANCNRGLLPLVKLTGTVKRPVRRAVVREYEVAAKVTAMGDAEAIDNAYPFHNHPECHGKAGVLIFRTAE